MSDTNYGALTVDPGLAGTQDGESDIFLQCACVAASQDAAKAALRKLTEGRLKGRSFRVRRVAGHA